MVSREDVLYAYRYLLEREPESEEAITSHAQSAHNRQQLILNFMASGEYQTLHPWGRRWFILPVLDDRRLMWVDLFDRYISFECLKGAWGPDEIAIVDALLRPGDTFIDAGANVGWFTMKASLIVGEQGTIHSFEPQPVIGEFLQRTIALNRLDSMITLHRAGLWSEPGAMHLTWGGTAENPGASHLTPNSSVNDGTSVPLLTLDSLDLDRCDLIKMDIEGAEYQALRGARSTMTRHRPVIMSELHYAQLPLVSGVDVTGFLHFMEELDYTCFAQQGPFRGERITTGDPRWTEAFLNVLFVPMEKAASVALDVFG